MRARVLFAAVLVRAVIAHADGAVTHRGHEVAATPGHAARARAECVDGEAACVASLERALTGLAFVPISATIGYLRDGRDAAGRVTADALSVDYPFGSAYLGRAELRLAPADGTTRLRYTLANAEAFFACDGEDGALHLPVLGQVEHACVPGARLGATVTLAEVQWDPSAGRFAARWGQVGAVLALAGTTSSMAYLHGHLFATLAVDAESVWHGHDDARTGSDHVARGIGAVDGMVRSDSRRWELRARIEARPALLGTTAAFSDVAALAQAAIVYHFVLGPRTIATTGVDLRGDYWRDPSMSIGAFDSVRDRTSVYVGALLEVRRAAWR